MKRFALVFSLITLSFFKLYSQLNRNNWLYNPSNPSYVSIGDLDVPGTQITVEAVFNRTTAYTGGQIWAGDLVSKHINPTDANYLLRPNNAEITTTNGYFRTPDICEIELNKTYHVALTYDGQTLKFYRNGFLMSSVPATGSLYQNDFITRIGWYEGQLYNTNLIGYINEVRIWNVVRSQAQIRSYMNASLPNPTTQIGLLAYYTFNNLTNKQGNAAWNGSIVGAASINATNPTCSNFVADSCRVITSVIPQFDVPDTVCLGTPVNITNTTSGASSYYWNFCVGSVNSSPTSVNIGNVGGVLTTPVFMDYVYSNGNYYGFSTNYYRGRLIRWNFGNSLLNIPTATDLGNFGGILPDYCEGIQVVQNEGKWYAIIVGGTDLMGVPARVLKIDFGIDISTNFPTATNWGNLGNLAQPLDLHVFQEGGNWYGFTVNGDNNTITRFNFTSSFDNTPTATNLGNIGGLAYPDGIYAVKDNNEWRVFITNGGNNSRSNGIWSLSRLDFGTSLLNVPTGINLGNPGGVLRHPRDLTIMKFCGETIGFAVNGAFGSNDMIKLDFNNDLTSVPTMTSMGVVGNSSFPHSISKIFRVNADLYAFITNVENSTVTRLQFTGCNNSNIPNSAIQNPPPIIYNAPGTYNINLTIDDGLATQNSVCKQVVVVAAPTKSPILKVNICDGQTIKIGKPHVNGTVYSWNSGESTDSILVNAPGYYWVDMSTSLSGCSVRDSILVVEELGDFNYSQNVCNPLQVQFNNAMFENTSINWNFGNGNTNVGDNNPVVTYNTQGNYNITLQVTTATGCNLIVQKTISLRTIIDSLIVTNDTIICKESKVQLNAIRALQYCWFPAVGLSATDIPNPIADAPLDSITYYLHSLVVEGNILSNGDFSQGSAAFTSDYSFIQNNTTEGQYFVGPNPVAWNATLSACKDHTSGNGNMLLVNGSPTPDANVWKQTVSVTPNTNYAFSTWIQALWDPNPARLQFSINGKTIGNQISATLPTCTWTQFYTTWNSGNNTTAEIAIVNKNTQIQGNDFALDDISFAPVFIKKDSVVISVEKTLVIARADTIICEGSQVPLTAAGTQTYSWTPATGLNNPNIANPIATPIISTQYIVTGKSTNGCEAKDTVMINVNARPVIVKSADALICKNSAVQLTAGGGTSYQWTPQDGLNNPAIANPIATPTVNTTYNVTVSDANNCSNVDSIKISIRPDPVFTITPDATICSNNSAELLAEGGDRYSWQPAGTLNNASIANPVASPSVSTLYTVLITDTVCGNTATLSTTITVQPAPTVVASKSNDIDCSNGTTQLSARGATQYQWTPATSLNNAAIANPTASPRIPTMYIVRGADRFGCSNTDSVFVDFKSTNDGLYLMPSAFSPNNDGLNDCYRAKYWGYVFEFEFSIFNRWGERVFHTKNASDCWNGTYKGIPQKADVYVYIIKAKTLCQESVFKKGTFALIR